MSEESKQTRSIFDLESEDMGKPLDKLDEYLRVSTPGKWLFVIALTLLAVALVFWGFFGTIPVNLTFKGVGISDKDVNTLSSADEIEVSEVIFPNGHPGLVPDLLSDLHVQVQRGALTHRRRHRRDQF